MPASVVANGWPSPEVGGGGVSVRLALAVSLSAVPVAMAQASTWALEVAAMAVAAAELVGAEVGDSGVGVGLPVFVQPAQKTARARAARSGPGETSGFVQEGLAGRVAEESDMAILPR
jgi:hypothetical protein